MKGKNINNRIFLKIVNNIIIIFSLIRNLNMTLTSYQHDIQITCPYAYQAILTL
jgi:hypothetical protein